MAIVVQQPHLVAARVKEPSQQTDDESNENQSDDVSNHGLGLTVRGERKRAWTDDRPAVSGRTSCACRAAPGT